MGGSLAFLLGNESVQKELKLDDKQFEKAKELSEKTARGDAREVPGPSRPRARKSGVPSSQEINREVNASTLKAAGEFLKPEQITRLKQISFTRCAGRKPSRDPEVAKKLNLTDNQKNRDPDDRTGGRWQEMRTIFQENQDDREARHEEDDQELNKKTLEKIVAKLNDEQQKTWKELLGTPFEIKYEQN